MSEKKQYSVFIRVICGFLGVLGLAAIAFNYSQAGEISIDFLSLVKAFALFIFLFLAIKGTNPLENMKNKDQ